MLGFEPAVFPLTAPSERRSPRRLFDVHRDPVYAKLVFSTSMGASASNPADYLVNQVTAKTTPKKPAKLKPVSFTVSYSDADDSVMLDLLGNQTFPKRGVLSLSFGLTSAAGAEHSGNNLFAISAGGKRISVE